MSPWLWAGAVLVVWAAVFAVVLVVAMVVGTFADRLPERLVRAVASALGAVVLVPLAVIEAPRWLRVGWREWKAGRWP